MTEPARRPANPNFSSGPCAKRPGWSVDVLAGATVGRSHRSKLGKGKLAAVIDKSRAVLGLPDDYVLGVVPASTDSSIRPMRPISVADPVATTSARACPCVTRVPA